MHALLIVWKLRNSDIHFSKLKSNMRVLVNLVNTNTTTNINAALSVNTN